MRHLKDKKHLNRTAEHRKALVSNLSAALFTHKKIVTTLAKAKYARRFAERMITFAREGDLASRRHVARYLRSPKALKILFDELGEHFKNRNGGYTRVIKLGPRRGDAAEMALLELVGFFDAGSEAPKPKKQAKQKSPDKTVAKPKKKVPAAVPPVPEKKEIEEVKELAHEVEEKQQDEVSDVDTSEIPPEATDEEVSETEEKGKE